MACFAISDHGRDEGRHPIRVPNEERLYHRPLSHWPRWHGVRHDQHVGAGGCHPGRKEWNLGTKGGRYGV